ncbi:MAG TPA: DUF6278 family protein [Polyangiaceae bacterium]|jgi:hypothetical protein|nr:DUF6278 family protein [Polyangiaceae bacterium]
MISGKETDDVSGAARPARGDSPPDEADEAQTDESSEVAEEEEEVGPQPPAPANVAELAAACVRFVATRYGAALDFAPETLSFVDHWLREARAEIAERPEAADVVQAAAGAYLGEVIRRTFGGFWVAEGDHADWRLELERVYCAFNPIGMAREALLLDTADGWHAHFELDPGEAEAIERRLAALPEAEDDEFYAPSTRFDVVSILFEALRTGMRARGLSDVRFTPEDYAS